MPPYQLMFPDRDTDDKKNIVIAAIDLALKIPSGMVLHARFAFVVHYSYAVCARWGWSHVWTRAFSETSSPQSHTNPTSSHLPTMLANRLAPACSHGRSNASSVRPTDHTTTALLLCSQSLWLSLFTLPP